MLMQIRVGVAVFLITLSLYAADLPVRQVVLYKNGVGYFERSGDLRPGETARLDFKATEMNDVLKSLSVVQKGGGPVTGLRYDSAEPLDRKLAEFPFRLDQGQPLSMFLDQLRGARVELKLLAGDGASGTILSARRVAGDGQKAEREILVLLSDNGEIKSYDLGLMSSLKFSDPTLELELKRFLATLTAARAKEKKSVYFDSSNDQARSLAVSYMIPMPVWKSSYRLIFAPTGEPTLEGWAVVDNTTGEDWTNVSLALVSGRPVSFISRLYEPRYVQRRVAELAEADVVGPQTYAPGMAGGVVGGITAGLPAAAPPPPPVAMYRANRQELKVTADAPQIQTSASESTIAVSAQGRELGDLFEYRFSTPVTVRKNESAMVPFLQQKLATKKLLIWTHGSALANPMSAAEITNTSGKTLDGGPITVFDASSYAGEALMETLKNADKRLISYAVDLGTRVTTNLETTRETVREVKAKNGILYTKTALLDTTTYTIKNVDGKAKTLILEHPVEEGETLTGNVKPVEKTATHYRFAVALAANSEQKFVVPAERIDEQTVQMSSWAPNEILVYIKNQKLPDAARRQLEALAAKKNQVEENARALANTEKEINELVRDQDRLRQNLTALNRVQGQEAQVRKYSTDLAASESRLAGLRDTLAEQRRRDQALRAELGALVDRLEW